MKDHEYIIALDIHPKDAETGFDYTYVTEKLGIQPSSVTRRGARFKGALGRQDYRYDRWYWRLATRPRSFASGNLSAHLVSFLSQLPRSKRIWAKLSESCECEIFLPLERDYFLIEFDLEPSASQELALRNLKLRVSTLSRSAKGA